MSYTNDVREKSEITICLHRSIFSLRRVKRKKNNNGEVRYNSLMRSNPEKAKKLFAKNEAEAKARYEYLNKLITLYGANKTEE